MDSVGSVGVVGNHHDGLVVLGIEGNEQVEYPGTGVQIEISGGLVCEQEAGFVYEGSGDGGALLLSARELAGAMVSPVGQSQQSEELQGLASHA